MTIDPAEWARFLALREALFAAIAESLKEDGHCKSYEGAFAIRRALPNYFEREQAETESNYPWEISLGCYLIGPHRHYRWVGDTFVEALEKAEIDIRAWIAGDDESRHFIED